MSALETARLALRRPQSADAAAIAAILSDHAVARMLSRVPQPYHLGDAQDWLKRVERPVPGVAHFAVTRPGGPMIGMVGIDRRNGAPHLGYYLARPFWGQGLMGEAVAAVIAWHFGNPDAETLRSGVFVDNAASLRLQEKLGFRVVGRSDVFSQARNAMVGHVDTVLARLDAAERLHEAA